ncbi:TolC family outer membrane protein [Stutzerimonas urumqiensis]|uniref:TolC family outer membrane protein n=1 Tax=Stutzerimonas urumqiensis TaxID=638269 RepID=UPI000EB3217C|nr:TolC family outer membrane protein [Stutzerimonas urumqiensis]
MATSFAHAAVAPVETPAVDKTGVLASTHVTDLAQLYREARLEDPRVLAAYARAEAAEAREREAFGALLPQLSANGAYNRTRRDDGTYAELYNNDRLSLGLTQHLYNKAAWENYQEFKNRARQQGFEAESAQAEATVDLAERYFAALAADDELELVIAEQRATRENLDRVEALYERQMAMITDVLDLRARVDALAAMEVEARNQVRLSREALSEIVGRPVTEKLSRIREDIALQAPQESIEDWVRRALASNPALKAHASAVEAANAALREGKGGHYPSVSFSINAQRSDVGYDNTLAPLTDTYVASIGVQVPIYSGGSTSARVRALRADEMAAEQELEAIRRQVVNQTTSAYLTAHAGVEQIRASYNALESAEQSSIAAQKGFQYGVVNSVDVLTSVQNEYQARRELLQAQYDFITNLLVLNRWSGGLSAGTVEKVNVWLSRNETPRALEEADTDSR